MLRNNKIFVFFTTFCILLIVLKGTVFATDTGSVDLSFWGFDSNEYNLPPIPDRGLKKEHYLLYLDHEGFTYLLCFNDSIDISWTAKDDNGIRVLCNNGKEDLILYTLPGAGDTWLTSISSDLGGVNIGPGTFIYADPSLHVYQNALVNKHDFFLTPPVKLSGVLPPIIQTEAPLGGVLREIIKVLPIILVILVGLIGLRKALRFLSKVLHHS